MRIVGVADQGQVFDARLPHGIDPVALAWDRGWSLDAPLGAVRGDDGDLVLTVAVSSADGPAPPVAPVRTDPGLRLDAGERPVVRQRIAAYAVVISAHGLLATEFSRQTAVPGVWGLPGGGLNPGEDPADAVRREVWEETAQRVQVGALAQVQSSHWVGRAPNGTAEDFQAIRLVYRADCPEPGVPRVLDVGGTTAQARWVLREEWTGVRWSTGWRAILATWPWD